MTGTLRDALRRFDEVLMTQRVPVVERRRGDEAPVRATIAGEGLMPAADVVTWWAWVGTPPPDERWARFVTPRHRLTTLDRAIALYRAFVAPPPDSDLLADPGWLPLAQFQHGGLVVADCSPGGDATVRVWNADSGIGGRGARLATVVGWWTGHVESGAWSWRDGGWVDALDDATLSEEQDHSFLV